MLGRVTLYTKRMPEMIAFYTTHFGFRVLQRDGDRITELRCPNGGPSLMLHAAAKSQKEGQVLAKLGFDVADVVATRDRLIAAGVKVGPLHDGIGYHYANFKDPSKNSVSITNRHLAVR
jgi:catechol 2,3-dioxygenase-like lactoylglutathione lyase family enzyme